MEANVGNLKDVIIMELFIASQSVSLFPQTTGIIKERTTNPTKKWFMTLGPRAKESSVYTYDESYGCGIGIVGGCLGI